MILKKILILYQIFYKNRRPFQIINRPLGRLTSVYGGLGSYVAMHIATKYLSLWPLCPGIKLRYSN